MPLRTAVDLARGRFLYIEGAAKRPFFVSRAVTIVLSSRLRFGLCYALRHVLISVAVALISALGVFGLLYPTPYYAMLGVAHIYVLLLAADVVCGPLLTLLLASPTKSRRERWLDFSLVGFVQLAALVYGLHSLWVARPVVLAFEVDRLVIATANEVDVNALPHAPHGMRHLPAFGVMRAGTRRAANAAEMMESVDLGLSGISPAMRPGWWIPWEDQRTAMQARAKPLAELIARRPQDAQALRDAARAAGADPASLFYLPLTSRKVKEWVALLDAGMNMVGYAPVDGFD